MSKSKLVLEVILLHFNGYTKEEIESKNLVEESLNSDIGQEIQRVLGENTSPKLSPCKLKVLHYAQVPCKPFEVEVKDEYEAKRIIDILANQHLFLEREGIIPDYSNVITVVMFNEEDQEWEDYFNDDEMMEWDEFEEEYLIKK